MIRTVFVICLLGFFLFSCQEKKAIEVYYYNIDSLVKKQISVLGEHTIILKKEISLNNKVDTIVITAKDSTLWSHELDMFRQLEIINNPNLAQAYNVENIPDTRSNLTVRTYSTLLKLPVKYVNLYFYKTPSNLRKIEAVYSVENSMFDNSRFLTMEFENIYNKITLTNYSIEGKQKMIMSDSSTFRIKGTLIIN